MADRFNDHILFYRPNDIVTGSSLFLDHLRELGELLDFLMVRLGARNLFHGVSKILAKLRNVELAITFLDTAMLEYDSFLTSKKRLRATIQHILKGVSAAQILDHFKLDLEAPTPAHVKLQPSVSGVKLLCLPHWHVPPHQEHIKHIIAFVTVETNDIPAIHFGCDKGTKVVVTPRAHHCRCSKAGLQDNNVSLHSDDSFDSLVPDNSPCFPLCSRVPNTPNGY